MQMSCYLIRLLLRAAHSGPEKGTIISCRTSITHSPQRTVPQTRTKTPPCLWRRWPRPSLSVTVVGGAIGCQSRAEPPAQKTKQKKITPNNFHFIYSFFIYHELIVLSFNFHPPNIFLKMQPIQITASSPLFQETSPHFLSPFLWHLL